MGPAAQSVLLGCLGGGLRVWHDSTPRVRIVSTTTKDLQQSVRQGRFRADLYHRLAAGTIAIPPLRQRVADIEHLARSFLAASPHSKHWNLPELKGDALELLMGYSWPGNVRQLQSVVELAVVSVHGGPITHRTIGQLVGQVETAPSVMIPVGTTLQEAERLLVSATLGSTGGNRQDAAAILGISRRTLYQKLETYRKEGAVSGEFPTQRKRRASDSGPAP